MQKAIITTTKKKQTINARNVKLHSMRFRLNTKDIFFCVELVSLPLPLLGRGYTPKKTKKNTAKQLVKYFCLGTSDSMLKDKVYTLTLACY